MALLQASTSANSQAMSSALLNPSSAKKAAAAVVARLTSFKSQGKDD
jgi:hypothetical protein